ncbi:MAG: LPXTG cell wall anchor domain-containing protein [Anaerolineae bacterium]|nr:LPXTG cell wall anchor domain-containing protein [Anaerolineae bacterium]
MKGRRILSLVVALLLSLGLVSTALAQTGGDQSGNQDADQSGQATDANMQGTTTPTTTTTTDQGAMGTQPGDQQQQGVQDPNMQGGEQQQQQGIQQGAQQGQQGTQQQAPGALPQTGGEIGLPWMTLALIVVGGLVLFSGLGLAVSRRS